MEKNFTVFLNQLSETNATLDYFVDFDKVKNKVSTIEIKLNQLNYLIGKADLKQVIQDLFNENPKTFDVIIETNGKTYLIETNYYNSGGSKLNEVARSYMDTASKINQYPNFEFVWITDGQGWLTAKNKLEEAYNQIPKVYNLTSVRAFFEEIIS